MGPSSPLGDSETLLLPAHSDWFTTIMRLHISCKPAGVGGTPVVPRWNHGA